MKKLLALCLCLAKGILHRDLHRASAKVARAAGSVNGMTIDTTAWTASMQTSFIIKAKVKFHSMNANYPNVFYGSGSSGMAFTSHGLGPAYGGNKGLSCFYLQTTTNLGPHGRGINYDGGWIPSKIRLDDGKWHSYELIKGLSGTTILVDGKRVEAHIKDAATQRHNFIMKPVSKIQVGSAVSNSGFDGDIKDLEIFTGGQRVYGSAPEQSQNLAEGRIATGSSDSKWGPYAQATDGILSSPWHAGDHDYPSTLVLDLGSMSKIDGMKIITPAHQNYGFKTLEIFRSNDGTSWDMVRADALGCKADRSSEHDGWREDTKFVKIVMKDRCGGGHFAIGEWQIFGVAAPNLALGIAPLGTDSKWGRLAGATDGRKDHVWHGANGDAPTSLTLNLGLPTSVAGMTFLTPSNSGNYGFKTLKIFRSMDGSAWQPVRIDTLTDCSAGRFSYHPGWPEQTKFVKIEMADLCGGAAFALVEWEIFGTQHKCKGNRLQVSGDSFPCDTVKDEQACRKSYVQVSSGETFQCGIRKASEEVANCLVVGECALEG